MSKEFIAILLGLVSFAVFMFVGEVWGLLAAFVAVSAYLGICQFLLSRGHANAHRDDWRIMLALDAPLLVTVLLMAVLEKPALTLAQGPVALFACAGTYAGAALAARLCRS